VTCFRSSNLYFFTSSPGDLLIVRIPSLIDSICPRTGGVVESLSTCLIERWVRLYPRYTLATPAPECRTRAKVDGVLAVQNRPVSPGGPPRPLAHKLLRCYSAFPFARVVRKISRRRWRGAAGIRSAIWLKVETFVFPRPIASRQATIASSYFF
jgi:hypothetical protein